MGMKRDDYTRHSKRVTSTRRWQVVRAAVLERDGYECRSCGARGRLEVDHIEPVRTRPDLAFDPANLQVLCQSHHTAKTRIECGLKPASEDRQAWRKFVLALEREGTNPKHIGEPHA